MAGVIGCNVFKSTGRSRVEGRAWMHCSRKSDGEFMKGEVRA